MVEGAEEVRRSAHKISSLNPSCSRQQIQCGTAVTQLSNRQLIQIIISLMIIDDHSANLTSFKQLPDSKWATAPVALRKRRSPQQGHAAVLPGRTCLTAVLMLNFKICSDMTIGYRSRFLIIESSTRSVSLWSYLLL